MSDLQKPSADSETRQNFGLVQKNLGENGQFYPCRQKSQENTHAVNENVDALKSQVLLFNPGVS